MYDRFDKAHNKEHIDRVIKNSLSIAKDYDVDMSKVYVIAATLQKSEILYLQDHWIIRYYLSYQL